MPERPSAAPPEPPEARQRTSRPGFPLCRESLTRVPALRKKWGVTYEVPNVSQCDPNHSYGNVNLLPCYKNNHLYIKIFRKNTDRLKENFQTTCSLTDPSNTVPTFMLQLPVFFYVHISESKKGGATGHTVAVWETL